MGTPLRSTFWIFAGRLGSALGSTSLCKLLSKTARARVEGSLVSGFQQRG